MADTVVEKIVIETHAAKPNLTGLMATYKELQKIDMALASIQQKFHAFTTDASFKKPKGFFEQTFATRKGVGRDEAAKVFGFSPADVKAYATNLRNTSKEEFRKVFTGAGEVFRSGPAMEKFFQQYQRAALRAHKHAANALNSLLMGGGGTAAGGGSAPAKMTAGQVSAIASGAEKIILNIPASMIEARLVGQVAAPVSSDSVISGGAVTGGRAGKKAAANAAAVGSFTSAPVSGSELRRRTTRSENEVTEAITKATGAFETITTITNAAGETLKEIETSNSMAELKGQVNQRLKSAREDLKRKAAAAFNPNRAEQSKGLAAVYAAAGNNLDALAKEFEGNFAKVQDMRPIADLKERAETMRSMSERETKRAAAHQAQQEARARREQERAEKIARAERDKEIRQDVKGAEAMGKDGEKRNRMRRAQLAQDERSKARAQRLLDREQAGQFAVAEAERVRAGLANNGFTQVGTKEGMRVVNGQRRNTVTQMFSKEEGGQKFGRALTVEFDQSGKAIEARLSGVQRAMKATRAEAGAAGRDMIRNIAHVSTWAAGVGVLYGAIGLATRGLSTMVSVGYETARLEQVFRGVGGSAGALRDEVLAMAAAEGRSADEAIESAIAWSRLGLTKKQAIEGVRVSLMAANVAEISAIEATEKLQGIMAAYRLRVGDLASVLGQANAISNTFNVTNKDMLEGLSRTASVAKQAGLSLSELMGLMGATVGTTGQTGANIGNMIKSITIALSNPENQKFLRKDFQVEARSGSTGDLKNLSEMLGDLWMSYSKATDAERQYLLTQIAGKTQASRMAAMLDAYVRAQVLAINAQLNLNSAEEENAKIKATLKAQLQGLVTEWDRFMSIRGDQGMTQGMSEITEGMHNLVRVMNAPGVSHGITALIALTTLLGARMLVTSMSLKAVAGQGGFFANTMRRASLSVKELSAAQDMSFRSSVRMAQGWMHMDKFWRGGLIRLRAMGIAMQTMGNARGGIMGGIGTMVGGSVKALSAGLAVMRNWLAPMAAIWAGMKGFNMLMETLGQSSDTANQKIATMESNARKAAAAAEAAMNTASLYAKAGKLLQEPNVSSSRKRALADDLKNLGKVSGGTDSLGLTGEESTRLKLLVEQGKMVEAAALMEEKRGQAVKRARLERQKEFESMVVGERKLEEEIKRLEGGMFTDDNLVAEQKAKLEELRGKRVSMIVEDQNGDSYKAMLEFDTDHQKSLERQKALLQSIAEIYRTLPASGAADKLGNEMAGLGVQLEAISRMEETINAGGKEEAAAKAEREREARVIEERMVKLREEYAAAAEAANYGGSSLLADNPAFKEHEELGGRLEMLRLDDDKDYARRKGEMAQLQQRKMEIEKERAAMEQQMEAAREQDRMRFATEGARAQAGEFDVGLNPTERLMNREEGLKGLIADKSRFIESGMGTEEQRRRAVVQLLQHEADLMDTILQKSTEQHRIAQDEAQLIREKNRERQRELLSAGPGELLKKYAAERLGRNGQMNMGAFFALDPQMREEMMKNPEFSPEMRELRQRKQQLGQPMTGDDLEKARAAAEERMGKARGNYQAPAGVTNLLVQTAAAASELGRLKTNASMASSSLLTLKANADAAAAAVAKAFALRESGGSSRGGNPQLAGHAAGRSGG